jgi:hypothetical protein
MYVEMNTDIGNGEQGSNAKIQVNQDERQGHP